jgi:hypothetical protein
MADDFLFDLLTDAIVGGEDPHEGTTPDGREYRLIAKRRYRRALQNEQLAQILPEPPAAGESVHAVTNAKYDFCSWLPTLLRWCGRADALYCSTWTLSQANALDIFALYDAGLVAPGQLHFLTGLYFKRRETATYNLLLDGLTKRGGRFKAFENHCKVLVVWSAERDLWLTVEGSANLNANPRFEQYVLTNDRGLAEFHRGWMDEVYVTPTKNYRSTTTARESPRGYDCPRAEGAVATRNDDYSRRWLRTVKAAPILDAAAVLKLAGDLAATIRTRLPAMPPGAVVTEPPQGATWPDDHLAARLAEAVAGILGLAHAPMLAGDAGRSERMLLTATPTGPVLVVDDQISTGRTMTEALRAIRAAGQPAHGFAWVG